MDATQHLPIHLSERVHRPAPNAGAVNQHGRYVMYWARTALRAHENPALDVAMVVASALGLPVFVYHALSERYPFASDRHHMFIMEGARDFAQELSERHIGTAFHLEREGHRGAHLLTLARDAALVITELMPVSPLREWTASLSSATTTPVWQVDCACVVPMTLTTTGYDRAFAYRDATTALRKERVSRTWPEVHVDALLPPRFVPTLPFKPVDLTNADFAELIGQCRIDHAVGPVADTRGGTKAGYARWRAFADSGRMDHYDRTRNNPAHHNGVSRLSAYLHYGMVSPFRVAREAAARAGDGAAKWLDELQVWREVAYTFCYHRADHATANALPQWARDTLANHERDARTLLDWERLARGQTADDFWNAMQHSLLAHGELHNSVRMTWGKAVAGWTRDATEALAMLIDLNHRYALDGRDPASFGGILWCLGQFDRPFTPETAVLGTVRSRPSSAHAARIDVGAYKQLARRPVHAHPKRIAVIGAGLSGLMCARTLADHHMSVTVFEKSRGLGGRCATRHEGVWHFDHGAPYFTIRDARLAPLVNAWSERGLIGPWNGSLVRYEAGEARAELTHEQRWVGVPGMRALGTHLGEGLDVALESTVSRVHRAGSQWCLEAHTGADLGVFDVVLVALPSAQARALLAPFAPTLAERLGNVTMSPTWATMLVLAKRPPVQWDGATLVDDGVLSWACRDASKPSRDAHETWVLHASREWSAAHLEDNPTDVGAAMLAALERLVGTALQPVHCVSHRWRYAQSEHPGTFPALYDSQEHLGAAGDWCVQQRIETGSKNRIENGIEKGIESALLSGIALAGHVLRHAHCHHHFAPNV